MDCQNKVVICPYHPGLTQRVVDRHVDDFYTIPKPLEGHRETTHK